MTGMLGPMGIIVQGDKVLSRYLDTRAVVVERQVENLIHTVTELTNTKIKANASGRPGPNAPTGDYRRSWVTSYAKTVAGFTGTAGTNKPQGRRLEFGFHGADALGRVYDQPPYPHVGPAYAWGTRALVRGADAIGRSL